MYGIPQRAKPAKAPIADPNEQLGLGVPKAGAATPAPGNPTRAAAMQAQYDQPVTGPRTPQAVSAKPIAAGVPGRTGEQTGTASDMAEGLAGASKVALGVAGYPALAAYDGVRNAAGALAGGDTSQIEQYRGGARSLISEGTDQMTTASANLRERTATSTREALGIAKAPDAVAQAPKALPAAPASTAAPVAATEPAAPQAPNQNAAAPELGVGWAKTGVGAGAAGGEIAMRRNEQGQVEFTNETASPEAVAGAQAMPAGGFGVPRRSAEGEGLAALGSAAKVGNGVGTFSQMPEGSSQEALARFERANQIRDEQLAEGGGIQVAGLRDSSRAPTLAERQNDRMEDRQAQREALRTQTQDGSDLNDQRLASEQLQQQKLQQDIATGQYGLEDQQRLADLRTQIADPSLSEDQRAKARQAYNVLATQAKDRYIAQDVVLGVDENSRPIVGKQVLDVTTGQPVASGQSQAPRRSVSQAEVEQTAKARGLSHEEVAKRLAAAGVTVSG